MNAKSTFWRTAKNWLPGLLISIIAFAILFNLVSFQELVDSFTLIKPLHIAIGVLLTLVSLVTRSMAWRTLIGPEAKFTTTFHVVGIGYLVNNVLPFRAGEFPRALVMGRASGLGTFRILSTIVIERSFDMAVGAGILLATLPLALGMEWARPVAISVLFLVVAGLTALFFMAKNQDWIVGLVSRLGKRLPIIERFIVPKVESTLQGFSALADPIKFMTSFFWIVVSWLLYVMIFYILLISVIPDAPFWWALFVDGVTALGVAIPSAPGSVGVYEAALVGGLTILEVPLSIAFALALVLHVLYYVVTSIMGFIGLSMMGQSMWDLFDEVLRRRVDDESPTPAA